MLPKPFLFLKEIESALHLRIVAQTFLEMVGKTIY